MIIFHEGLPGSGKSYEALVKHIIPSLEKGRKVYARLNGFNYEKVSELTGKTVEELEILYTEITEEQVLTVYDIVENDSLLVLDELQNFFPSGRQKLSDEMTRFIAEHRHRGMDIICMGQALADVHTTWKRRTERKISFLKLSMVGMDSKYKWEMYQGSINGVKGDVVFKKIKSGVEKYDSKYFGSYLSHQLTTDNTDVYSDDRVNIFKTKQFMVYIPIFIFVIAFAIYFLTSFFNGETQIVNTKSKEPSNGPVANVQNQDGLEVKHLNKKVNEKSTLSPITHYGLTKVLAEEVSNFFIREYKMNITGLRLPIVIGPGLNYRGVASGVSDMANATKEKRDIIVDMPDTPLDIIYVKDVPEIFVKLINSKLILKNIYNAPSYRTYADQIANHFNKHTNTSNVKINNIGSGTTYPKMQANSFQKDIKYSLKYTLEKSIKDWINEL